MDNYQILTETIGEKNMNTIKALSLVKIKGEIQDRNSNLLNGFNGDLAVKVFDKSKKIETLENDPDSGPFTFNLQKNVLFNGRTKVVNGTFEVTFLAPKDMDYSYGNGKISYYAQNENEDALVKITGENPVKEEDNGNSEKMTMSWLEWAKSKNIAL